MKEFIYQENQIIDHFQNERVLFLARKTKDKENERILLL